MPMCPSGPTYCQHSSLKLLFEAQIERHLIWMSVAPPLKIQVDVGGNMIAAKVLPKSNFITHSTFNI